MRLACPPERLDCLPIAEVKLNLSCRDEIIPMITGRKPTNIPGGPGDPPPLSS